MTHLDYNTPNELAGFVHDKLSTLKTAEPIPSLSVLQEIVNCAYYTSMKTEEGQHINVTLTYISPQWVKSRIDDRYDTCRLYPFKEPVELTVTKLVKLSKAADPWSSSLAFYHDGEKIQIHGMIDQSIHYQSYLHHEHEDKPRSPGLFQLLVTGIGNLSVMVDFEPIAALNKHTISKRNIDVFRLGKIADYLKENCKLKKGEIEKIIENTITGQDLKELNTQYFKSIVQSLTRILLRIRNYNHGGALLITTDFTNGLKIKYSIDYSRVRSANLHLLASFDFMERLDVKIDKLEKRKMDIPCSLFEEYIDYDLNIEDADNELKGAIRFVASLSCVDGLILLSPQLEVSGFGTIISEKAKVESVFVSNTARIGRDFKEVAASHFGTRHQSMFSYCSRNENSIGFVVSQDGEIRAVKNVDGKVYIWEDIKVHRYLKSSKLIRPIVRRKG